MAIEAQGVQIRRASTTLLSTGATSVDVAATALTNATCDFTAAGFTTAMYIALSTLDTALHPIKSFSGANASVINIHGSFNTTGTTALTITAYDMELVGEITDFTGPGGAAAVIDITNVQSTAKEKLIGLRDEGQLSLSLNFNATDAGQQGLRDDRSSRNRNKFVILMTDVATGSSAFPSWCFFNGYCMNFSIAGSVDNKVSANAVIEIDGPVIWSTNVSV